MAFCHLLALQHIASADSASDADSALNSEMFKTVF